MDTAQAPCQRRTFARANGLGSGGAVPHLVAAEERHRKNLQHIRQLKAALCSTVSSAAPQQPPSPRSRGESPPSSSPSLASPALQAWGVTRDGSSGAVASPSASALLASSRPSAPPPSRPHPARETAISAAVLQSSQHEVEQLVREKHQLQRQCVELANLLADTQHGGASSALAFTAAASGDMPGWSAVHDAAVAVVEQVTRCYPDVVQDWAIARPANEAARPGITKKGTPNATASSMVASARRESSTHGESAEITADELADALLQLADFLPQLASMTAVSELIAEAGPDMLDHIHALEEEKRSDCAAVLSITDHLTKITAQMRSEAAEKDAAMQALQLTVEDLMEEKHEWSRRARASEAALAERYTQYRQREKAWEREVAELLRSKDSVAPAVEAVPQIEDNVEAMRTAAEEREADMREQLAHLQDELDKKGAALGGLQEKHDALVSTNATLQASSQAAATAQQERIAVLEGRLQPLESELQMQAETINATMQKVGELSAAHRAEVAKLNDSHKAALGEKENALEALEAEKERMQAALADAHASMTQRTAELHTLTTARDAAQAALQEREQISVADSSVFQAAATSPLRLAGGVADSVDVSVVDDGAADDLSLNSPSRLGEEDNDQSTDSISRCTNVRKLQQSVKRMSRERTALKRKLEHRATALAEMETELEAAQRLVAQQAAQIQVLHADLESAKPSGAAFDDAAAPEAERAASVAPVNWITFAELEEHEEEGTLYPTPVDLSGWLLNRKEPLRFADYVARHLNQHDQLLIGAVGSLYHIGYTLLKAEGLLDSELHFPMIWRRLLLQLQQVLDVQLEGLAVSAADSAHRFYVLASSAGFFKEQKDSPDALAAYTLILASLSLCLSPRCGEDTTAWASPSNLKLEEDAHEQQEARASSARSCQGAEWDFALTKWRCCQAILRHVCAQGDGEDETTRQLQAPGGTGEATPFALFTKLSQDDFAAAILIASDSGASGVPEEGYRSNRSGEVVEVAAASSSSFASTNPPFTLASLLSNSLLSSSLALSHFSLQVCAFQQVGRCKAALGDDRRDAGHAAEHRLFSPAMTSLVKPPQQLTFISLLLYISRYEYLLGGWKETVTSSLSEAEEAESATIIFPSLKNLGVHRSVSSSNASKEVHARTEAGDVVETLMLLDTGLLPAITMSICLCRSLEDEPRLLPDFFTTRRALVERHEALLPDRAVKTAAPQLQLLPAVPLLSDRQLRECVQRILTPARYAPSVSQRVVQVPAAEYERLHRELLSLYQTNETYEAHIHELLGAVEAM